MHTSGQRAPCLSQTSPACRPSQASSVGVDKPWGPRQRCFNNYAPSVHSDLLSIQRPSWLPPYIPELQGLRGLAVLAVVIYHCHPRLQGTWLYYPSLWGWAAVTLFFVLSSFLITSILLEARDKPHYFRNFYARRALRIWPVYVLVLIVVYLEAPWFIGPTISAAISA